MPITADDIGSMSFGEVHVGTIANPNYVDKTVRTPPNLPLQGAHHQLKLHIGGEKPSAVGLSTDPLMLRSSGKTRAARRCFMRP